MLIKFIKSIQHFYGFFKIICWDQIIKLIKKNYSCTVYKRWQKHQNHILDYWNKKWIKKITYRNWSKKIKFLLYNKKWKEKKCWMWFRKDVTSAPWVHVKHCFQTLLVLVDNCYQTLLKLVKGWQLLS